MDKMDAMYGPLSIEVYNITDEITPGEIHLYTDFFDKKAKILEPMCGSGRFLIPLLQAGYSAHGADISELMLSSCKTRAGAYGLTPTLFHGGIENMTLPETYDVIVIPYGSFQLLHPKNCAYNSLENMKKHLLPNGKLIIDLFIAWEILNDQENKYYTQRMVKPNANTMIHVNSEVITDRNERYSIYNNYYKKTVDEKVVAEENEQMKLCWYFQQDMESLLASQGFRNIKYIEKYFDDYQHLIYVAENFA